jgi:hypothetical protein
VENLTPKELKLKVSADCARDPGLADRITTFVGFDPKWSQMSVHQLWKVQVAWELFTYRNREEIK